MADLSLPDLPPPPLDPGSSGAPSSSSSGGTPSNLCLDPQTISQIVNGLQQASIAGATALPARDIALHTDHLASDPQTQADYIPPPAQRHYIHDVPASAPVYYDDRAAADAQEQWFHELQIPFLLSLLYLVFQMPFVRRMLLQYLPSLCNADGQYNFNGCLFVGLMFGTAYYGLVKLLRYLA